MNYGEKAMSLESLNIITISTYLSLSILLLIYLSIHSCVCVPANWNVHPLEQDPFRAVPSPELIMGGSPQTIREQANLRIG
jgi:hypothetical protein